MPMYLRRTTGWSYTHCPGVWMSSVVDAPGWSESRGAVLWYINIIGEKEENCKCQFTPSYDLPGSKTSFLEGAVGAIIL